LAKDREVAPDRAHERYSVAPPAAWPDGLAKAECANVRTHALSTGVFAPSHGPPFVPADVHQTSTPKHRPISPRSDSERRRCRFCRVRLCSAPLASPTFPCRARLIARGHCRRPTEVDRVSRAPCPIWAWKAAERLTRRRSSLDWPQRGGRPMVHDPETRACARGEEAWSVSVGLQAVSG
jgi:hypothetical protein